MGPLGYFSSVIAMLSLFGLFRARFPRPAKDAHPRCRHCDFDLFGLPRSSARCPECGADLSAVGTIQTRPRPRRGLAALSLVFLLAGLAGINADFFGLDQPLIRQRTLIEANQWIRHHAPAVWLTRNAATGTVSYNDIVELSRRLHTGALSDSTARRLVGVALDRKLIAWRQFIELAYNHHLVSDADLARYLSFAVTVDLKVRTSVRRGDPLPCTVLVRSMTSSAYAYSAHTTIRPDVGATASTGPSPDDQFIFPRPTPHLVDAADLADLADGPHTAILDAEVTAYVGDARSRRPIASFHVQTRSLWQLVSTSQPSVTLTSSSGPPVLVPYVAVIYGRRQRDVLEVELAPALSIGPDLAYRVLVRASGREWPIGTYTYYQSNSTANVNASARVSDFPPSVALADVILRPDPDIAAQDVAVTAIDGREIVLPAVPIKRMVRPVSAPAAAPSP